MPPPPPAPDRSPEALAPLVDRARGGDAEAVARLCELFHPEVFRFLVRRLPREDAEDLANEICLRAVRGLPEQDGFFPAWLYRIARNLLVDHFRRRGRAAEESLESQPPPERDAAIAPLERVAVKLDLEAALARLPEEQREVIRLRLVEGYSAAEVGEILGKSAEAVRAQQLRALRALRRHLGGRRVSP